MSFVKLEELCGILYEVLQINDELRSFDSTTQLLGSLPEFDSMAVVSVIAAIEDNFGVLVDDDEVTAELFETVGALHEFIQGKVAV